MGDDQAAGIPQQGKRKDDRRGAWLLVPVAVVVILVLLLLLVTCNSGSNTQVSQQGAATPATDVKVPDLIGMPVSTATPLLNTIDLRLSLETSTSAEPEEQTIVLQTPKAGVTVSPGTTVTVTVVAPEVPEPEPFVPMESQGYPSSGPSQVTGKGRTRTPSVVGLTPDAAARRIRAAGLEPTGLARPVGNGEKQGVVFGQFPGPGVVLPLGSEVTYRYYKL